MIELRLGGRSDGFWVHALPLVGAMSSFNGPLRLCRVSRTSALIGSSSCGRDAKLQNRSMVAHSIEANSRGDNVRVRTHSPRHAHCSSHPSAFEIVRSHGISTTWRRHESLILVRARFPGWRGARHRGHGGHRRLGPWRARLAPRTGSAQLRLPALTHRTAGTRRKPALSPQACALSSSVGSARAIL